MKHDKLINTNIKKTQIKFKTKFKIDELKFLNYYYSQKLRLFFCK